jgi:hypothetical protein
MNNEECGNRKVARSCSRLFIIHFSLFIPVPSSALLTIKFVWPREEFLARTIVKRHPEERLLAATKACPELAEGDLLLPGLAMSVAERAEQQVLRPRVRPQDDASYLGRGRLVGALPRRVHCVLSVPRKQRCKSQMFGNLGHLETFSLGC